jgi:hypothetical protein
VYDVGNTVNKSFTAATAAAQANEQTNKRNRTTQNKTKQDKQHARHVHTLDTCTRRSSNTYMDGTNNTPVHCQRERMDARSEERTYLDGGLRACPARVGINDEFVRQVFNDAVQCAREAGLDGLRGFRFINPGKELFLWAHT